MVLAAHCLVQEVSAHADYLHNHYDNEDTVKLRPHSCTITVYLRSSALSIMTDCKSRASLQCEYGCDTSNVELSWRSKYTMGTVIFCLGRGPRS